MINKVASRSIKTTRTLSATGLWGILAAAGCGAAPGEFELAQEVDDVEQVEQEVTPNPGSTQTVTIEPNSLTGAYPEVMWTALALGCTGTVVGPYAVLTAKHCGSAGTIRWNGTTFAVGSSVINPYLDFKDDPVWTPDWWITLNNQQMAAGGRQDDWPAQHDLIMLFVPALTPVFLRDNKITPALVTGYVGTSNFRIVGVASTGGSNRAHMAAAFRPSIANTITVAPRDGYLSRNTGANFAYGDGGDSGGPTFWLDVQPWLSGQTYVTRRTIAGTLQNVGVGGELPPLAYNPGITMTANQQLTTRLNSMWAQARADDADGDGVPYDCDTRPDSASELDNNCPAPMGGPTGPTTQMTPVGMLQCRPGYVPTGLTGRFGDLIDRLSLRCVAYSCFDRPESCGDAYTTDAFGGETGTPLSQECASGSVLLGAHGRASSTVIGSIGSKCTPMSRIRSDQGRAFATNLAAMGTGTSGSLYDFDCALRNEGGHDSWLSGFQARTSDKRWATGLHPICDQAYHRAAPYVGGSGGGMTFQTCPVGQVAVGTMQRNQDGMVNLFGLLCADQVAVKNGVTIADSALTLVRTSFLHYAGGFVNSQAIEPYNSRHVPSGTTRSNCSTGYAMTGVSVNYTSLLTRVNSFTCKNIRPGQSGTQTVNVNIGGTGGTTASSTCPFGGQVNGLYARSGWLVDGVAMSCVDF